MIHSDRYRNEQVVHGRGDAMRTYLSVSGVGRRLKLTSAAVRAIADRGGLRIAAKTESGARLFYPADVERLARARRGSSARSRKRARAA
jgi:hypothetical protein